MTNKLQAWVTWLIVSFFVVYSFCLNTASAVFSHSIRIALHLTTIETSYALSAFIVGFACMQIPAGYWLDRFNTKKVVAIGIGLLAIGNLLISFSSELWLFSIANFIQGCGGAFAFIAAGVVIGQWFPPKMFPILFGLTQAVSCILAGLIHYFFVQALLVYAWTSLYQFLAIFGFILLGLAYFFVSSPAAVNDTRRGPSLSLGQSLLRVCSSKQVWLCTIAGATSFGVLLAYSAFWYTQVEMFYEVTTDNSLIISGLIFAGMGIGTPVLGLVSNLLKSRKMMIHITLTLGAMMLLLSIYLPHFSLNSYFFIDIISFLLGFMLSGSMLFYTIVSESNSNQTRGMALSITNTGVFLFNTFMMFIPYALTTDSSPFFFTFLWILPFTVMIAILLSYFIKETYHA